MKSILLATDLAIETNRAFERAVALASSLGAQLHILHVCPVYSSFGKKKQTISLKQDAKDMIKKTLSACKGVKQVKTSITVIEGGEIFAEIINHAEKVKAGLLVMGLHGKVKLRDMFVGTTVERVVRKGIRPVLMVKDTARRDYKNVLVGTDFSSAADQAFCLSMELAPKGTFYLLHAYGFTQVYFGDQMAKYAEDALEGHVTQKLEDFVKNNKKIMKKYTIGPEKIHPRKVKGEATSNLIGEASKVNADLIAIGTHSHISLMPYTLGGTAKDILSSPPCDILIAKGL